MLDVFEVTQTRHFSEIFPLHPPLIRVLHYEEKYGLSTPEWQARELGGAVLWGEDNHVGLPEYVSLIGDFVRLTEPLQFYGLSLLQKSAGDTMSHEQVVHAYSWLMDGNTAFTNKFGSGTCAFYPDGRNLDKEDMRQFPVVTGGNYFELLDTTPLLVYGQLCWKIKAFNINEPFPDPANWREDYRVFRATNSWATRMADGSIKRGVDEFPQLGGKDVPVPLLSNSGFFFIRCIDSVFVDPFEPLKSPYYG